jgi:hypothetical protein
MSKEELIGENWVPQELKSQIMAFGPLQEHIQVGNNARNKDVLEQYCDILFPKGRIFASRQQLFQAAKIFSAPWAYQTVHVNHQFMCSYGKHKSQKNKGTTLKDDKSSVHSLSGTPLLGTTRGRKWQSFLPFDLCAR